MAIIVYTTHDGRGDGAQRTRWRDTVAACRLSDRGRRALHDISALQFSDEFHGLLYMVLQWLRFTVREMGSHGFSVRLKLDSWQLCHGGHGWFERGRYNGVNR
ncbi:Tat pathway signal sequence domain protein [Sesbania bispinosa]|nr:Tat pathway signal sequence domain protein [Sesbania bispinosa]